MKKFSYTLLATLVIGLLIVSCIPTIAAIAASKKAKKKRANTEQVKDSTSLEAIDMHSAENSLDFYGIYEGTIRPDDGGKVKVSLQLNKDGTFFMKLMYPEKKGGEVDEGGRFTVEGNLVRLPFDTGKVQYYKAEEGRLVFFNHEKPKKRKYKLKQIETF